jgi:hypothetical protein
MSDVRSIQYAITLPDEYDMALIEDRARAKAPLFASLPGLELKAFLAASPADGARCNVYAPFYVWRHSTELADFLIGPLFGAVIDGFGRPAVLDRQVLAFGVADQAAAPLVATFESMAADRGAQPAEIWQWEKWAQRGALSQPGLCAACSLLDTTSWTVTRVRFWADAAAVRGVSEAAQRLRVLAVVGSAVGASPSTRAEAVGSTNRAAARRGLDMAAADGQAGEKRNMPQWNP